MTVTLQATGDTGPTLRVINSTDMGWDPAVEPIDVFVSGTAGGETTVDDSIFMQYTGATIQHVGVAYPVYQGTPQSAEIGFSSADESVATVDQSGLAGYVANGTAKILIAGPVGTRKIAFPVSATGGQSENLFDRFVAGSLSAASAGQIDTALDGLSPSPTTRNIFSSADHEAGTYVRNASCFAAGFNLTPWVVWSSGTSYRPGTLIAPDVVCNANHAPFNVGDTVRFVTAGNVVVDRTIVATSQVGSIDVRVYRLASDVPAGISFCKLMPAAWHDYVPSINDQYATGGNGVPIIYSDKDKRVQTANVWRYQSLGDLVYKVAALFQPRSDFWLPAQSGDSGNSGCVVIAGELVVVDFYSAVNSIANDASQHLAAFNTALSAIGSMYTVTTFDLSGFTSYGA